MRKEKMVLKNKHRIRAQMIESTIKKEGSK